MKQTQNSPQTPELQILAAIDKLSAMSVNITDEDRALAAEKLNISKRTVAKYVKEGNGSNLDTAIKLIGFFQKRIDDRAKILAS